MIEQLPQEGEMSELVDKINEMIDSINELHEKVDSADKRVKSVAYENDPLNRIG